MIKVRSLLKLENVNATIYFFSHMPDTNISTGDGVAFVYGYGIGFILWFIAVYTLAIAISFRNRALQVNQRINAYLMYLSLILLACTIIFTLVKSTIDRTTASTHQKNRFGNTFLYKRGTVCTKEYQSKTFLQPVDTLKVDVDTTHYFLPRFEWDWLFYNYKTIQVADYEYQRTNRDKTSYNELYQIQPISKAAEAELSLDYVGEEPKYKLSARLIDSRSNEILFDNAWDVALSSYYSHYGECGQPTPYDFVRNAQTITHSDMAPYFLIQSITSYPASTEIIEASFQNRYNREDKVFQNCPSNIQFIEQENRPQFLLNIIDQSVSNRLTTLLKVHKRYFLLRAITLSCNHKKIHLFDNSHIVTFDPENPSDQLEYYITNIDKLPFRKGDIASILEKKDLLIVQFYDSDTQMINEVTFKPINQK